ncbi:MAG: ATP-binding cassette domain-containing protein [Bacteroidia bacterium]|nr:ATP-binding cassette domain-containing protein [Bacteroidia bacterium]
MKLSMENIGKRFQYHWIFRKIEVSIASNQVLTIKGPNGSGKSTLLKIISGFLSPSEGTVQFKMNNRVIADYYQHVAYAAPYVDLVNQFTLPELIRFQKKFKPFRTNIDEETILDILGFANIKSKIIKDFSSGMQQRVKLALGILSASEICILDEPTTNLDREGFRWYEQLVTEYRGDSAMVIASNESRDFVLEDKSLNIDDYKS